MPLEKDNTIENVEYLLEELGEWVQPAKMLYSKKNYKAAMAEVIKNVVHGKRIKVRYDFDFDGIGSCVILYRYLEKLYKIVHGEEKGSLMIDYAVSDPEEGHGLTQKSFDKDMNDGYSLVIAVDMGSDSEIVKDGLKGFLALDHHPSKNHQPYIINPNTGRKDKLSFGTSGGKVVYDFISNIDRTLSKTNIFPDYKEKYRNPRFMNALKGIAAQTLVSDMATWDKNNRKFFTSVRESGAFSAENLPFYSRLKGDDSAISFSFNIISIGNSASRMKGVFEPRGMSKIKDYDAFDINMVFEWLSPDNIDRWIKIDSVLQEVNEKKKDLVREFYADSILLNGKENNKGYAFYFNEDMPHRLSGLIANKISISQNTIPTLCATIKKNGDIAMSGRGDNVKELISYIFNSDKIVDKSKNKPEDFFGGHPNASGGTIKIPKGKTYEDMLNIVIERIEEYSRKYDLSSLKRKTEIVTSKPVSVSVYKELLELFKEKSGGAEYRKRLYVPVAGYEYGGISEFASKWQSVGIMDGVTGEDVEFLVDGSTFDTKERVFGAEDRVLLMELTTNGKGSLFSAFDNVEDYLKNVTLVEELTNRTSLDTDYIIEESDHKEEYVEARVDDDVLAEMADDVEKDIQEEIDAESKQVKISSPKSVTTLEFITSEIVEASPDKIFVFGDNLLGRGKGGQAIIRDNPNAHGVPTKRKPNMNSDAFFGEPLNEKEEGAAILSALNDLYKNHYLKGKEIVFPKDGLGSGRAKLKEKMPEFFLFIHLTIMDKFGCSEYKSLVDEGKEAVKAKISSKAKKDITSSSPQNKNKGKGNQG